MHDIRFIRDHPEAFDAGLKKRNLPSLAAELLAIDKRRRAAISESEAAQARRKALSRQIGIAKGKGEPADALMSEVANLEESLKKGEAEAQRLDEELTRRLEALPNLPFDDVPDGTDETGNVEIRRVGNQRNFRLAPKDHVALGEATGEMDLPPRARSRLRFVFERPAGELGARSRSSCSTVLPSERGGYTDQSAFLVRDNAVYGVDQLPRFAEDMFHTDNGFWLIPTGQKVPLTNLVNTPCWTRRTCAAALHRLDADARSEAGAAGDTRGMIRQHQFLKVELVSITTPEQAAAEHERMTRPRREVLKRLGIAFPHHCAVRRRHGAGFPPDLRHRSLAASQNAYREISSCSNCGDYQAPRMGVRYRPKEGPNGSKGGTRFVHTLNGSGLACGRTLIAVLENYQNEDGSVTIPEVLRSYMGGLTTIPGPVARK
jgi:seryl-tRNA synthetase